MEGSPWIHYMAQLIMPFLSPHWKPTLPPHTETHPWAVVFFPWEAIQEKALTLDNVQKRWISLTNRCFLCLDFMEFVNHLLLYCTQTWVLWSLLLSLFGISWIMPASMKETLLSWNKQFVGKRRKIAPLCIFWIVCRLRNRTAFNNL